MDKLYWLAIASICAGVAAAIYLGSLIVMDTWTHYRPQVNRWWRHRKAIWNREAREYAGGRLGLLGRMDFERHYFECPTCALDVIREEERLKDLRTTVYAYLAKTGEVLGNGAMVLDQASLIARAIVEAELRDQRKGTNEAI